MPFKSAQTAVPSVKSSNKTAPPSTIRLKGWLNKQKHGRCRAWLKRYFVLYGEEIRYYKNNTDTNALAVISLDHYILVPDGQPLTSLNQKQWRYHTFCLVSDDETKYDWPDYFLQADNAEDRAVWVECLQQHVSQSTSVLEKWLDRLELPQEGMPVIASLYSRTGSDRITNHSSPTLPPDQQQLERQQQQSFISNVSSNILLPPLQHSLQGHKSVESLNTFTTKSSASGGYNKNKRRPSDFTTSRSTDLSSRLFSSKIFSWTRPKSSASSIASSKNSISTNIIDNNSSELLATPNTPLKPIESPIIHPSEYNHDDDPSERVASLRQNTKPVDNNLNAVNDSTTNYYYGQHNLYQKETTTTA